jgi:glucosamine--fructose-6-phosphate aminotransferase (isomerizing)
VSSPLPSPPGQLFIAEIREQPAALLRLLEHTAEFESVGRTLAARAPSAVRLIGHGTSDNAAVYAVYAFGLLCGWTALRDSISLTVYYDAPLDFSTSAVVALSQSGATPDVVEYVHRARRRGALTIGVTNEPDSELAGAAEIVLPLAAGPERAVAATKTYVNQLAAIALLAGAASDRGRELADQLRRTAAALEGVIDSLEPAVSAATVPFSYVGRMFVIGRGLEFATAREIALKLTETCQVAAEPLTATAFSHGPVAALDPLFPVWTIASRDESLPAVIDAAAKVRDAGGILVASGSAAEGIAADYAFPVPDAPAPVLAPLLSVVPGQLFSGALARAKGLDPDRPHRLSKVTRAA